MGHEKGRHFQNHQLQIRSDILCRMVQGRKISRDNIDGRYPQYIRHKNLGSASYSTRWSTNRVKGVWLRSRLHQHAWADICSNRVATYQGVWVQEQYFAPTSQIFRTLWCGEEPDFRRKEENAVVNWPWWLCEALGMQWGVKAYR
jgi:hypothetical protein